MNDTQMNASDITLEHRPDDVAILWMDARGQNVNILKTEFVAALESALASLESKPPKGLVIASKKTGQFIAGASIDEIKSINDPKEASQKAQMGQSLMNRIQNLPFTTVAAINGPAIGGGLELSLACTHRIASNDGDVKLSLPEVRLGILPGFGGSQRLPRLVGLTKSLDIMLTGKTLRPKQALKAGLIDDLVHPNALMETAAVWALKKKPRSMPTPSWKDGLPGVLSVVLKAARKKVGTTAKHYPAPKAILSVVEKTFPSKLTDEDFQIEANAIGKLIASKESKSLISIFQGTERIKKDHRYMPREINRVGVLGAGVMGGGMAHMFLKNGHSVRMRDISAEALLGGMKTVDGLLKKSLKRKHLTKAQYSALRNQITPTLDSKGFGNIEFLAEAIVEDLDIKRQVLSTFESLVPKTCVLATNTSALPIGDIAKALERKEKLIGFHFFNPVDKMPLMEVIPSEHTDEETIQMAMGMALKLGKTPIKVKDMPGFLVNRLLGLYLVESSRMLEEGIDIQRIEDAMVDFGMPMGPFELMDEVGLDVAGKVGKFLKASFDHFPKVTPATDLMVEKGRLGRKNGKGFYQYSGKDKSLDKTYLEKTFGYRFESSSAGIDVIQNRLVYLLINECTRCLESEIVDSAEDLDLAMVLGTGFAPFQGGPLRYADTTGRTRVADALLKYSQSHGSHYSPTTLLISRAETHTPFRTS